MNKAFLASAIDKKEYSRTLLVDDGSAKEARSADAFRSTPRRERHSGRSPRRKRSPRHDSPCSSPRGGLSSEPIADLVRKKRDRSKARTTVLPVATLLHEGTNQRSGLTVLLDRLLHPDRWVLFLLLSHLPLPGLVARGLTEVRLLDRRMSSLELLLQSLKPFLFLRPYRFQVRQMTFFY